MSLIIDHAATALGVLLAGKVQLGQPPVIIDAPPSQLAEYPALAVWIEKTVPMFTQAAPVLVGEDGTILIGGDATDEDGNILDGDPLMLSGDTYVSSVGTIRCSGRLWIGSRYPAKREELEQRVWFEFMQDDARRGILLIDITAAKLGDFTIPFGTATVAIGESTWSGEHSFEARLWDFLRFDMDLPLLVPRTDPMAAHLILELSRDLNTPVTTPTDVPKLPDLEKWTFNDSGDLVTTTL